MRRETACTLRCAKSTNVAFVNSLLPPLASHRHRLVALVRRITSVQVWQIPKTRFPHQWCHHRLWQPRNKSTKSATIIIIHFSHIRILKFQFSPIVLLQSFMALRAQWHCYLQHSALQNSVTPQSIVLTYTCNSQFRVKPQPTFLFHMLACANPPDSDANFQNYNCQLHVEQIAPECI